MSPRLEGRTITLDGAAFFFAHLESVSRGSSPHGPLLPSFQFHCLRGVGTVNSPLRHAAILQDCRPLVAAPRQGYDDEVVLFATGIFKISPSIMPQSQCDNSSSEHELYLKLFITNGGGW